MLDIHVSKGNLSEDKDTTIFNLPAIVTCPVHAQCYKTCYARKAEKRFKAVVVSRDRNLVATRDPRFVGDMVTLLGRGKNRKVRIHESGDFYSSKYISVWCSIIRKLPDHQFKTFTKVESAYRILSELPNCAAHYSILPGGEINYGSDTVVRGLADKYKAFNCPKKGARDLHGKRIHSCSSVSCSKCWDKGEQHIVFTKH
jgi:hypothetical protein